MNATHPSLNLTTTDLQCDGRPGALIGTMHTFHGFRVLDANGETVGSLDWIWTSVERDQAEFIGVHLQWLRGKAQAVPVSDVRVDTENRTLHLAHTNAQIKGAPRFPIVGDLTVHQKLSILSHYTEHPAAERGMVNARSLAA